MGRSKKTATGGSGGGGGGGGPKSYCYWCDKDFPGEEVLIQHQVAKHFRCPHCKSGNAGKCINLECLVMHFRKVHRAELLTVPNAKEGRNDPIETQHIYGMANVPVEVLEGWGVDVGAPPEGGPPPEPPAPEPAFTIPPSEPPPVPGLPGLPGLPPLPPVGESAPAGQDWSQQVQQWMNANKPPTPAEPPPLPVAAAPAPAPAPSPSNVGFSQPVPQPAFPQSQPAFPLSQPAFPPQSAQSFQGFSLGSNSRPAVDAAAATGAIAEFMETAKLSANSVAMSSSSAAPAEPPQPAPAVAAPGASPWIISFDVAGAASTSSQNLAQSVVSRRSRSRDKRSRSRDRRRRSRSRSRRRSYSRGRRDRDTRDKPRDPQPSWRPPPMEKGGGKGGGSSALAENRTIQIIEGAIRSRLQLKGEMEKFGRVETVYMGNRHDPSAEPPLVKFENEASAQMALNAINTGQVFFDGMTVKAEMKKSGRRPMTRDIEREVDSKLHITSRDFARDDRRGRGPPRW